MKWGSEIDETIASPAKEVAIIADEIMMKVLKREMKKDVSFLVNIKTEEKIAVNIKDTTKSAEKKIRANPNLRINLKNL